MKPLSSIHSLRPRPSSVGQLCSSRTVTVTVRPGARHGFAASVAAIGKPLQGRGLSSSAPVGQANASGSAADTKTLVEQVAALQRAAAQLSERVASLEAAALLPTGEQSANGTTGRLQPSTTDDSAAAHVGAVGVDRLTTRELIIDRGAAVIFGALGVLVLLFVFAAFYAGLRIMLDVAGIKALPPRPSRW